MSATAPQSPFVSPSFPNRSAAARPNFSREMSLRQEIAAKLAPSGLKAPLKSPVLSKSSAQLQAPRVLFSLQVRDLLPQEPVVQCVKEGDTVASALEVISYAKALGTGITDRNGFFVGTIHVFDIFEHCKKQLQQHVEQEVAAACFELKEKLKSFPVEQFISDNNRHCVYETNQLSELVSLFLEDPKIRAVGVLNSEDRVVGVLTMCDVLEYLHVHRAKLGDKIKYRVRDIMDSNEGPVTGNEESLRFTFQEFWSKHYSGLFASANCNSVLDNFLNYVQYIQTTFPSETQPLESVKSQEKLENVMHVLRSMKTCTVINGRGVPIGVLKPCNLFKVFFL